jgi:hypothetical protein
MLVADEAGKRGRDDRWYVTNGVVAVGPVGFDLLTRGVARGRIPAGSFVRHESWKMWRALEDVGALTKADRQQAVAHFADISAAIDSRASDPENQPPPPLSEVESKSDSKPASRPSLRPVAVDPVGVLASASNLDDALLLALSTSVTAASASVGLLHRARYDLGLVVTSFAHGPGAEAMLGERLHPDDPTLAAARGGHTVIAEPHFGESGRYLAGRIGRGLPNPCGLAMVPLVLYGKLLAMVEVGRNARLFRAYEIARVEDVVEALAERIVDAGWVD